MYRGQFGSLADALDYAAQGRTGCNFYDASGRLSAVLPYRLLRAQAIDLARRLMSLGIERGGRVAIIAETSPVFHRFFFACQYAGLVPVPLPAALQMGGGDAYVAQIRRMMQSCGAAAAVAPDDFVDFLSRATRGLDMKLAGAEVDFLKLPHSSQALQPLAEGESAYLQYTSGSTRFPRGVDMPQESALQNLAEIAERGVCLSEGDRLVSWLPFYHDMGLVGFVLVPLASQLSVDYLSPRTFAMRPRLWLKLISDNRGTVSSSPPSGYSLCATRLRLTDQDKYNLSSWRVACVGAERINYRLLEQFAQVLAPAGFDPKAFVACYGMAECGLAVSFAPLSSGVSIDRVEKTTLLDTGRAVPNADVPALDAMHLVDCGVPLPSYELKICDDAGDRLPERQCGRILVRGPSVMRGYFGDPESTAEVLSEDGWLDTGDIGYTVDGTLVVTARRKDVIILSGRNIWPQDIEYLAESMPEVRVGHTSAFSVTRPSGDEMAVLVVEDRRSDPDLALRVAALIRAHFGIACHIDIVPPRTLPRTSSGKLSRSTASRGFLDRIEWDSQGNPVPLKLLEAHG